MCVTAMVVGAAALGAVGQFGSSIAKANADKANAKYQRDIEQKQLREQERAIEIQALEQENARTAELEALRSSSFAAIGASGLGEHISFFQGMAVEDQAQMLRDVRATRLNLTQAKVTLADQINVSGFNYKIAKQNSTFAKMAAASEMVQQVASAAAMGAGYGIPGGSKAPAAAKAPSVVSRSPTVTVYNTGHIPTMPRQ